jgi:hypothetical protein
MDPCNANLWTPSSRTKAPNKVLQATRNSGAALAVAGA